jgi:hypothetical protein
MLSLVLVAALVASASAIEMNGGNFNALVKESGKNAFVKFQAPW